MRLLRRDIPLAIAILVGLTMLVQFFVPHPVSRLINQQSADWFIIVQGIVLLLGVISVTQVHVRKIARQDAGWGYSLIFFGGMLTMIIVGCIYQAGSTKLAENQVNWYDWLYANTIGPLSLSLFSMLAFFITSAAARAFRAKSLDATLLLGAALIVMFGIVPWGEQLTGGRVGPVVQWVLTVPNLAASRAIGIGIALGVIATSLKILAGVERSYLGND